MSYALVGEFTVTGARNRGNKPNPHGGELTKWYVDLEDDQGNPVRNEGGVVADVYWQRKAGSEVTVGDKIYGKVEEGDHGLRFKLEPKPDGGARGGREDAAGSSKREWKPESQYDPEKVARITRAHAQKMGLQWAEILAADSPEVRDGLTLAKVFQFADAFQHDIETNGQAAIQGAGASATPHAQASPPAATPAPESQSTDTAQYFTKLLEDCAMDRVAALELGKFIAHKFSWSQCQRAESGLRELGSQQDTVKRLTSAYEKSEGKLLPLSTDPAPGEEPLPF